jgi:hypothetical protein
MSTIQPIDLHDVAAYWKSRKLVREDQIPYYVRWLQRFLAGPGADARLSPQDAQRVFVDQLERTGQIQEWLVRQATRAVELYQKHYLRFRQEQSGVKSEGTSQPNANGQPETLEVAINETRRLIRIRHYAYRTEQTYLGWLGEQVSKGGI